MTMTLDGTNGVTFNDTSLQGAAASPYVLKNRIINGDMRIDQRNNGASVTPTADGTYVIDRFKQRLSVASKYSVQQVTSTTIGFTKSMKITSLATTALGAGDYYAIEQDIEGYNIADLGWGTASAKTVTLSFVVNSSLTGTFGGCIQNGTANRSYPFTYSIPVANTDTTISVTIAGDTSGTWNTTTSAGIVVFIGLGVGTTYSGTAGSWSSNNYVSATGATSVVGTNGATFYITGVQLEQNTVATPFERRLYNQEFANCQRYYQVIKGGSGSASSSTAFESFFQFSPMRSAPSASLSAAAKIEAPAVTTYTQSSASVSISRADPVAAKFVLGNFTGLTNSRYYSFAGTETSAGVLQLSAEL